MSRDVARMMPSLRVLALVITLFSILTSVYALPVAVQDAQHLLQRRPPAVVEAARGRHAAVASESDICTEVGIRLSEEGGNAADMVLLPPQSILNTERLMRAIDGGHDAVHRRRGNVSCWVSHRTFDLFVYLAWNSFHIIFWVLYPRLLYSLLPSKSSIE